MAGVHRSTGITQLQRYHDPIRLPPAQPHRLCIPSAAQRYNLSANGSLRFPTILSKRAVRSHPVGLNDCTCLYFITHTGFTPPGRLTIPNIISGPNPVHTFALRLASYADPGFAAPVTRIPRQVSYMFTGSYMIEPFIQQGRPDLA